MELDFDPKRNISTLDYLQISIKKPITLVKILLIVRLLIIRKLVKNWYSVFFFCLE